MGNNALSYYWQPPIPPLTQVGNELFTMNHLQGLSQFRDPNLQLEVYRSLEKALKRYRIVYTVTITTTKPLCNPVDAEQCMRKLMFMLRKKYCGRQVPRLLLFPVLERHCRTFKGSDRYHFHILVGELQGESRETSWLQGAFQRLKFKCIFRHKALKIRFLNDGKGRLARPFFDTRYTTEQKIDYVMKGLRRGDLNVAWTGVLMLGWNFTGNAQDAVALN